jgi:hypothetical protein
VAGSCESNDVNVVKTSVICEGVDSDKPECRSSEPATESKLPIGSGDSSIGGQLEKEEGVEALNDCDVENLQGAPIAMEIDDSVSETCDQRAATVGDSFQRVELCHASTSSSISEMAEQVIHPGASSEDAPVTEVEQDDHSGAVGESIPRVGGANEEPEKDFETGNVDTCEDDGDYEVILDDDIPDDESADIVAACLEHIIDSVFENVLTKSTAAGVDAVIVSAPGDGICQVTLSDCVNDECLAASDDAGGAILDDTAAYSLIGSSSYVEECVPCETTFEEVVSAETEVDELSTGVAFGVLTDTADVLLAGGEGTAETAGFESLEMADDILSSEMGGDSTVPVLPDSIAVKCIEDDVLLQPSASDVQLTLDDGKMIDGCSDNNCTASTAGGNNDSNQTANVGESSDVLPMDDCVADSSGNDGNFRLTFGDSGVILMTSRDLSTGSLNQLSICILMQRLMLLFLFSIGERCSRCELMCHLSFIGAVGSAVIFTFLHQAFFIYAYK